MQHLRSLTTAAFVRRGAGAFAVAALALATIAPAASLAAGTPVAANDAYSTAEDTALVVAAPGVMVNDADANGTVGSGSELENAALVMGPTHGSFTFHDDGSFSYTPLTNYAGPDSFTYKVVDGLGVWSPAGTVTLTVTPVNDAPVCTHGSSTSLEDHSPTLLLASRCTDVDGDAISFSVSTPPAHLTLTVETNGWSSYTPDPDFNGPDSFGITASDGHGGTGTFSVGVTITPVNDAPTCLPASAGGNEDATIPGTGTCTDVDGDSLTFSRTSQALHGTATVAADGTFTYQPAANWHGSDSFTATAADGHGGSATFTVSLTVASVNDAPVCSDPSLADIEDEAASGPFANCTDADADPLTYALAGQASHGLASVDPNGSWAFTPAPDWNGSDTFDVTASDGHGGTTPFTAHMAIAPVNDAPTCSPASAGGNEDATIPGGLAGSCSDVDGDTLTFSQATQASHGTATVAADGTFSYQPAANWHGSDSFTVRAADGDLLSATFTVSVTVASVNDAPVCSDPSLAGSEDGPASGAFANCTDIESDTLTHALTGQASHGAAAVDPNGSWTFTPAADWNGSDTFGVGVSDGHGGATTFSATVTVAPVNDPPVAADFPIVVAQNRAFTIIDTLTHATDVDHDALSVSSVTQGLHGSVTIATSGSLVYTPTSAAYTGPDSFTYAVSDGHLSDTATVSVEVVRDTEPPVAAAPTVGLLANPSATTVRLIASWSGSDAQTAVATFNVEWQLGSTAWRPLYHGTARSVALSVPTGTMSVGFRVAATDLAGNASPVVTSTWTLRRGDSAAPGIVRHGTWRTIRSTGSVGRSYLVARSRGAGVSWTVNGPATVGIVAPLVIGGGTAKVYVDGAYRASISFASSATHTARLLKVVSVAGPGKHVVRIVSQSKKLATFDAFFSVAARS